LLLAWLYLPTWRWGQFAFPNMGGLLSYCKSPITDDSSLHSNSRENLISKFLGVCSTIFRMKFQAPKLNSFRIFFQRQSRYYWFSIIQMIRFVPCVMFQRYSFVSLYGASVVPTSEFQITHWFILINSSIERSSIKTFHYEFHKIVYLLLHLIF
jgi:hypothetical protein